MTVLLKSLKLTMLLAILASSAFALQSPETAIHIKVTPTEDFKYDHAFANAKRTGTQLELDLGKGRIVVAEDRDAMTDKLYREFGWQNIKGSHVILWPVDDRGKVFRKFDGSPAVHILDARGENEGGLQRVASVEALRHPGKVLDVEGSKIRIGFSTPDGYPEGKHVGIYRGNEFVSLCKIIFNDGDVCTGTLESQVKPIALGDQVRPLIRWSANSIDAIEGIFDSAVLPGRELKEGHILIRDKQGLRRLPLGDLETGTQKIIESVDPEFRRAVARSEWEMKLAADAADYYLYPDLEKLSVFLGEEGRAEVAEFQLLELPAGSRRRLLTTHTGLLTALESELADEIAFEQSLRAEYEALRRQLLDFKAQAEQDADGQQILRSLGGHRSRLMQIAEAKQAELATLENDPSYIATYRRLDRETDTQERAWANHVNSAPTPFERYSRLELVAQERSRFRVFLNQQLAPFERPMQVLEEELSSIRADLVPAFRIDLD